MVGANIYPVPHAPHFPHPLPDLPPKLPTQTDKNTHKGLQKYFSVQDVCGTCTSESSPHFDLWMGVPSYANKTQLNICADAITVSTATATVIVHPNDGYDVDSTPLMTATGTCDTDADYDRTQPTGGNGDGSPSTTLSTVVSSPSAGVRESKSLGSGHCGWKGHCRGASCGSDTDCADPLSCVNGVCT